MDLTDWDGNTADAVYSGFTVGGESTNYKLNFDRFMGGNISKSFDWTNKETDRQTDRQTEKITDKEGQRYREMERLEETRQR